MMMMMIMIWSRYPRWKFKLEEREVRKNEDSQHLLYLCPSRRQLWHRRRWPLQSAISSGRWPFDEKPSLHGNTLPLSCIHRSGKRRRWRIRSWRGNKWSHTCHKSAPLAVSQAASTGPCSWARLRTWDWACRSSFRERGHAEFSRHIRCPAAESIPNQKPVLREVLQVSQ